MMSHNLLERLRRNPIVSVTFMFLFVGPGLSWAKAGGLSFEDIERMAASEQLVQRREALDALTCTWDRPATRLRLLSKFVTDPNVGVRREASTSALWYVNVEQVVVPNPTTSLSRYRSSGKLDANELKERAELLGSLERLQEALDVTSKMDGEAAQLAQKTLERIAPLIAARRLRAELGTGTERRSDDRAKVRILGGELQDLAGKPILVLAGDGPSNRVSSWSFSHDGLLLAVGIYYNSISHGDGTKRGSVYLFDAVTGKDVGCIAGRLGPVTHVSFSPDGRTLYFTTAGKYEERGGR
jgi:WD40 repeat protein